MVALSVPIDSHNGFQFSLATVYHVAQSGDFTTNICEAYACLDMDPSEYIT